MTSYVDSDEFKNKAAAFQAEAQKRRERAGREVFDADTEVTAEVSSPEELVRVLRDKVAQE